MKKVGDVEMKCTIEQTLNGYIVCVVNEFGRTHSTVHISFEDLVNDLAMRFGVIDRYSEREILVSETFKTRE